MDEGLFRKIWTWAFLFALVVMLFISLAPEGGAETNNLYVVLTPQPQPLSWLGFYDVLFPVDITVLIYNLSNETFPGGNLTGFVKTPSNKWILPQSFEISEIAPNQSRTFVLRFKPEEAGVYTVELRDLKLPPKVPSWNWQVSGGFLPIQVEPPSTLINALVLTVLIVGILALVTSAFILRRRSAPGLPIDQPAPTRDTLLKAFNQFDAGKNIEKYLLDAKDAENFESAVSWLLQIIGFHAMKLNDKAKGQSLRVDGAEVGSADILAYDPQTGRLLVVDCTIGVPESAKLQRIKNSAERLRSPTCDCDAVLITGQDAALPKRDAYAKGIVMLDKADLTRIITFISEKRLAKAKKMFE